MPTVLIANRGEIAVRVVRACRRVGANAVVAVSEADRDSLAARLADRVVCIGASPASQSYLRADVLAQAALCVGADAIHPGYGFASEQPELSQFCEDNGIAFAGPRPDTLETVGDKSAARTAAQASGVPVAAGAPVVDESSAVTAADEIGYPLLIKAVHGGGGRGIGLVSDRSGLVAMLPTLAAEARSAFGDGSLYLERYFADARHIEVQVFGDGEGEAITIGERDCSVQRRHQKLLEECPAPGIGPDVQAALHSAALALAKSLRYRGAGTVEFLVDIESQAIVFLEMNARIQVEHPVTEEAFGVDLVAEQLRLALGMALTLPKEPMQASGHVIECRINAEDPAADFRPQPGRLTKLRFPAGPGIRIDTHAFEGYLFPPYYDSLLAKVIVRAHDRAAAIDSMSAALRALEVEGVPTTASAQLDILSRPDFQRGGVSTRWLDGIREKAS
jgi:acetyl-CoA carboxylase biotin carboxylase subunit